MPRQQKRVTPSLFSGVGTLEKRLPDGRIVRQNVPIGPFGEVRGLLGKDAMGWSGDSPYDWRKPRVAQMIGLPKPPPARDQITAIHPNYSERLGIWIGDKLEGLGMGRDGRRIGRDIGWVSHNLTPVGIGDDVIHPRDRWDRPAAIATIVAPPVARAVGKTAVRGAKAAIREAVAGTRAARTAAREARVPARPEARAEIDVPRESYANHSWESVPGSNTGHLEGFKNLRPEHREDYHGRVKTVFQAGSGDSRIARGHRQQTRGSFDNVGYYEGDVNPGTQDRVRVWLDETGRVTPASASSMDSIAATQGLLGAQKGAAWNHFTPTRPEIPHDINAIRFDLGRPMSRDDVRRIGPQVQEVYQGGGLILPDEKGFRIAQPKPEPGTPHVQDFGDQLAQQHPQLRDAERVPGIHSGDYIENAWDGSGRYGADYGRVLLQQGGSGIGKRFDSFAPEIAERMIDLDADTAVRHGLRTSEDIELLRRTIADKGWDGFISLIRNGRISGAVVPLVFGWMGLQGAPQENEKSR